MSIIQRFLDRIRRKRPTPSHFAAVGDGPVILTPHGQVNEGARAQAEVNLRLDPVKRARVFEIILKECGGHLDAALVEARRRYPAGGF